MSNTADNALKQSLQSASRASSWDEEEKIEQIAQHFKEIMKVLELDLESDSLKDTPLRVAKMYIQELFRGLNPARRPKVTLFENKCNYEEMVIEKNIPFFSCCEHHFVPIQGTAHVAYVSSGQIIGLSKINRIVHYCAARPQLQERLTQEIAAEMSRILDTENVAVYIDAIHFCVIARGVSDINSRTCTQYLGGCFRTAPMREEFLRLIQ